MIERAAGCLENGGRCLLRKSKSKPFYSRRSLHSAFWSHGAGNIDLPSWWIALLQVPQIDKEICTSDGSRTSAADKVFGAQEVGFLDFLYPARTLAIFHRLVKTDRESRRALNRRPNNLQVSRAYASVATGNINDTASRNDATMSSSELEEALTVMDVQASANKQPWVELSNSEKILSRLNEILTSEENEAYNEAWYHYQKLQDLSVPQSQLLYRMLRYLASSPTAVDAQRSLLICDTVPLYQRGKEYYTYALSAALRKDDLAAAIKFRREAYTRDLGFHGTSLILRYTIRRQKWKEAVETWRDSRHADAWAGVLSISLLDLIETAISAVDFASQMADAENQLAVDACDFARQLAHISFSAKAGKINVDRHRILFEKVNLLKGPTSGMYTAAISQLLSSEDEAQGVMAIRYYSELREEQRIVPEKELLRAILVKAHAIRSQDGVLKVLDDFREYHSGPPREDLWLIIRALSREGNIEVVEVLFQEYLDRFGRPKGNRLYNSILFAYNRRADIGKVVENFHSLQQIHGFQPDLISWNYVIGTYARVGDVDGAMKWYEMLIGSGLRPDHYSYFCLMNMYARRGDLEEVTRLLVQSEDDEVVTTISMLDCLVLAYTKNDQLENARKIAEEALQMNLKGSRSQMWNFLINAYAMQGNLEKMIEIYRFMRENDVLLDATTYAGLMHGLVLRKYPDAAYRILQVVMPRAGIRANSFHYALIMGGYLATECYDQVFILHLKMMKRNMQPVLGTQNFLLRAAAKLDIIENQITSSPNPQADLSRAEEVIQQTLENIDPAEFALSQPVKFLGPNRLDDVFSSTYFSYMIFIYGKLKAFDKVSKLYDQYISTSNRFFPNLDVSPPTEMLSALMVANVESQNYEEVDKCWNLALQKSEKLARRANADLSQPGWVLPSRRFVLILPLIHYIRSLGLQGRIDDLTSTVNALHRAGYALNSKCWNAYISVLASNGRATIAFELCERELIGNWPGWHALGYKLDLRRKFYTMKPKASRPQDRMPSYHTLVYLARAYLRARVKIGGAEELRKLAPLTVNAVINMPNYKDAVQNQIFGRDS